MTNTRTNARMNTRTNTGTNTRTTTRFCAAVAIALGLAAASGAAPVAYAQAPSGGKMAAASAMTDGGFTWGPAPAIFPKGAQMAVVQGDPGSTALFTVRLRFPDGYRIAPHTHPTDENITVISGAFRVGMGKSMVPAQMMTLKAGGFVTAPANAAHYAIATGATEVQVHAMGPFAMTYVNAADTPKAARNQ